MAVSQRTRILILPAAMLLGGMFHGFMDRLGSVPQYLIFAILFITFTQISLKDIRFSGLHWILLCIQIFAGIAVYLSVRCFSEVAAQGLMLSVLAPAAMASVVIAGMLGANVTTVAVFCLLSNASVAFIAPVLFAAIGAHSGIPFMYSALLVLSKVGPLLILPFLLAWSLEKLAPKWHRAVRDRQEISFWLWAASLTIVIGRTVKFIVEQPRENILIEVVLGAGALLLCLAQFSLGRYIGGRYGDKVAGGQSLGQKNNILAIWMAQTYLDPLSSVAPAMYVIWQNIVNSCQLWRCKK